MPLEGVQYFADENALGLAKLLIRQGRNDIVHPGHERLPAVPRGTRDLDWMYQAARLDLIVLTRDRRIRTRPAELATYRELGVKSVWIGGKRDTGSRELAGIFLQHEERLLWEATKRGPGPWALAMTKSGVRPLNLRSGP